MINLKNDYCYVGHPKVLENLLKYNDEKYVGYGLDEHSYRAANLIKKELENDQVDIHFLVGGTITNKVAIAHSLKPYEAVICCETGHINVHETGAIEETGHKVLYGKSVDGKLYPDEIERIVLTHGDEHMVKPKMVYISQSTEYGTIYTKEELSKIYTTCQKNNLYLYIDGARIGSALMCNFNDVMLKDLPNLCDIFYIGGTKNGTPLGEALVVVNEALKPEIRYSIKHYGGMYAKGFVVGISFETLFENGLFYEIAKKENELAMKLKNELKNLNLDFYNDSNTNQQFVWFDKKTAEKIQEEIACEVFIAEPDRMCLRFVTCYQTTEEDIKKAVQIIKNSL